MNHWIDRILLALLVLVTLALTVTAFPSLSGNLKGDVLRYHMLASGPLVVGLPICALVWLRYFFAPEVSRRRRFLYLSVFALGLATIVTVFLCMMPVASTHTMHELMKWHGWTGYGLAAAVCVLVVSAFIKPNSTKESRGA